MKVAINISPLNNAHKTRGIGYYTMHLIDDLKQDKDIEVQEFTRLSELKDADIIHYPFFDLFFHTLPIKKKLPTVVTIHDVSPLVFKKNYPVGLKGKINLMLQKMALENCKYIITDSDVSKQDITVNLKVESRKVNVIPLAADDKFKVLNNTRLLHVKKQHNLPDRFLLYVGDVNWVKNLPFLIEGFQHLINLPLFSDVKLILVGGAFLKDVTSTNHSELQSLKLVNKLIKQYKLEKNIIRPGQLKNNDLIAFYNLATLYVQPSIYEGFGLPVLEAFACGTPVISSNRGSLPEVGGKAAVYFNPDNLNQFVSITAELLGDKSLLNKLSRLGFQQVSRFSWKKVALETKSVYYKAWSR